MSPEGVGLRALRYWEARQTALSNNLANVSTPGFKGERVFARLIDELTMVAQARTDFSPGSVNPTGRPLDIALEGEGFLVVRTDRGSRWVRGGALALDESGRVVDGAGNPVLGTSGPLVLPPGRVEVDHDGTVKVEGDPVGAFLVERARGDEAPRRAGANLWIPPPDKEEIPAREVRVRQGHLEESNVNPVSALVEMIEIQRAYAAVQKSMQAVDGARGTITTEIGRLG